MNKTSVGVIGVGHLGKIHANLYQQIELAELKGVYDTDQDKAKKIAADLNVKAFSDCDELLDNVEAVNIVTPTSSHFEVARLALGKDCHLFIEKPITTTLEEADILIEIADARNAIIQVGHVERFNPAIIGLENVISQPMFIESHRLSIYQERGTDVDVVLDLMIHDIDIILNFVRSEIKNIHAAGVAVITKHIDIANARLEFVNGCVANVTASRISTKNERKIRLFQPDAYISVDFAKREITVIKKGEKAEEGLIPGMQIDQLNFTQRDALEDELNAFVGSVKRREVPAVTGQMGREALRIALSIMEQIQSSNRRVLGS